MSFFLMGKVYRYRGWETALLLTASLPQRYSGRDKREGIRSWQGGTDTQVTAEQQRCLGPGEGE